MIPDFTFPAITAWVQVACDPSRSHCLCGRDLRGDEVRGYPHDGGWETDNGKMWLFIPCRNCGYEMALWKMGVSRDQDFRDLHRFSEQMLCDLAWAEPDPAGVRVITARGRSR